MPGFVKNQEWSANAQRDKEITMTTNETLDAFAKNLDLDETSKATLATIIDTLREAAPRLCGSPRLLAIALSDIYTDRDTRLIDGNIKTTFRLTAKHIAHCASIERTLMSLEKEQDDDIYGIKKLEARAKERREREQINQDIRKGLESNHFNKSQLKHDIEMFAGATGRSELDVAMDALEYLRMGDWFKKDHY